MLIKNKTNLDYSTLGLIIDTIIENSKGTTHYVGQIEWTTLEIGIYKIKVQIRYLKRYVEWYFTELGE